MSLGGGTFIAQNKVLPGAYINFISTATASANLVGRGIAAMGVELDWGKEGQIFEVSNADFKNDSMKIFGYSFADTKMKGLRDLFRNIKTLYVYRLTSGGIKASNSLATALYCGVRGNDIKISVQANLDNPAMYDVQTWFGTVMVDSQTVAKAEDLVANDYVVFKEFTLQITASTALEGGTNGIVGVEAHQDFLDKVESYPSINAIGYAGADDSIKELYVAFAKRLRDEVGVKFQVVLHDKAADYEGVVNVKNGADLVYWVTGVIAGTAVNASATNKLYDGEFDVNTDYTQVVLGKALQAGEFVLHQVGSDVRVLEDINSLVSTTENKGEIFKDNQTVRVCDQIATDIANLFVTKYLGAVPNDAAGRVSLWADIVKHHEELQNIRAIEDFSDEDVTVEQGESKKSVVVTDKVTVVNSMTKLYMTVYVG